MAIKEILVSELQYDSKPTLDLKEHETINFIGNLPILDDDKRQVSFLYDKKVELISTTKGLRISAGPYIGSAEFENFILTVNPKFTELKNIGRLIHYAYGIKEKDIFLDSEVKFLEAKNQPMELIIYLYVHFCQKLLRKGLSKSYQTKHDNIPYVRGKLLLQNQLKNDARFNLRFDCEFDEFTSDNLDNQILLYCLQKCYQLTKESFTKKVIRKIIHQMDTEVTLKLIILSDFEKISYTRLNSHYKNSHILGKLILKHLGILNLQKQKTSFIVPYFIPMFRVFEKFLTRLFEENYPLAIKEQVSTDSWIAKDLPREITPDIITYDSTRKEKGTENSIIDAKYMALEKFGESELYQIIFYLHDYNRKTGYAILPYSKEDHTCTVWHAANQNKTIHVKHIKIDKILDLIYEKKDNHEEISEILEDLVPIT